MKVVTGRALRGRLHPATVRALSRRLARAARRVGARPDAIAVRIVDDAEISALHQQHMGLAGPTDVLSFPAPHVPGQASPMLGDIVLGWDVALRQAAGRPVVDELTDLAIHGLAHLLGHDHGTRQAARVMVRIERRAARAADLPPPRRPYVGGDA